MRGQEGAVMRILMLSEYTSGLIKAWEKAGYIVINPKGDSIVDMDYENALKVIRTFEQDGHIDLAFSYDFNLDISNICETMGILYIAWIADSPHISLLTDSIYNRVNRIFTFDYAQWQMLQDMGCEDSYHLPLCADSDLFQDSISRAGEEAHGKYGSDVAFMGNLYDDNLYDKISYLPSAIRGYIDAVMKAQRCIWGMDIVEQTISSQLYDEIRRYVKLDMKSNFREGYYEYFFTGIIHKKIAQLERKEVCDYLAKHFDFALYTGSDTSYNPEINNRGKVDYRREMPLVFRYSKININITLHSIETGIPLRVMDILGCGGFCLTNYQAEIAEFFTDGEDLVMYTDFNDMYHKIRYYLEHEEEREAIARSGYRKVRENFNCDVGVRTILSYMKS